MQKWEYTEIEVTIGGPLSGTSATVWQYNKDGKHPDFVGKFGQMLAELGSKGWELVASSARIESGLTGKHKINYILKRPLPD